MMQDLATLKNTKLYAKKSLGPLASSVRSKLRLQDDKKLLLGEMYSFSVMKLREVRKSLGRGH
jgi:hypothetical protein